jgi:hypothetical protein
VVEAIAVSLRAIVVLLVLLVAALAWLLWFDEPGQGSQGEAPVGSLLSYAPERIRAIEIAYRSGETLLERAEDGAWWVSRPVAREADPGKVDGLLRALSEVGVMRVVTDDPGSDLDAFGLATAQGRLVLFTEADTPARRFELGGVSPVGGERYLRDDAGAVLLVESSIAQILGRVPGSFIERRFVPVEAGEVSGITVRGPASALRLELREGEWWLTDPVEDLADGGIAADLIQALTELRAVKLLDAEEIDLARGAFDAPVTLIVDAGRGDEATGVEIGAPAGPDRRFARRPGDATFWGIVKETQVRLLAREADDLRERRLAPFSRPDVTEVRIETAEGVLTLTRGGGQTWNAADGEEVAADLPGESVEAFLDRLRWLRAREFGALGGKPGVPLLEIVVSGETAELGRLTLEQLTEARDPSATVALRARSSWRPGFVFTVGAEFLDAVPRRVDDLRGLSEKASRGDQAG